MTPAEQLISEQKNFFAAGSTTMPDARLAALYCLNDTIETSRPVTMALMRGDGLSEAEVSRQMDAVRSELALWQKDLLRLLRFGWKKAEGGKPQPIGTLLILGASGAAFAETLRTVFAAIAAGNTLILNLDKNTPAVADCIRTVLSETFEENYITVCGEHHEELAAMAFDATFDASDDTAESLCSREGLRRFSCFEKPGEES